MGGERTRPDVIVDRTFKSIIRGDSPTTCQVPPWHESVQERVSDMVTDRFERICGLTALTIPLAWSRQGDTKESVPMPVHPACVDLVGSPECDASWHAHLAECGHCHEGHWHRCDHGRLCAFVPLILHGQCLMACKLVCAEPITEEAFVQKAEILTVLVENFLEREGDLIARLISSEQVSAEAGPPPMYVSRNKPDRSIDHPKVKNDIDYIHQNLADPSMTVASIAIALYIGSTYLSHLFSEQVGMRMHHYISSCRIELAKALLATTDHLVKQIAHESGHANADWFIHVFHTQTGITPGEFRRRIRKRQGH